MTGFRQIGGQLLGQDDCSGLLLDGTAEELEGQPAPRGAGPWRERSVRSASLKDGEMPVDRDKLLAKGQALFKKSKSVEEVLSYFRSQGANKIDCISIMKRLTNISQRDAKRVVHFSAAWADVKDADDAFHEQLWEAIKRGDIPDIEWYEEPDPPIPSSSVPATADGDRSAPVRESGLRGIKMRLSQFLAECATKLQEEKKIGRAKLHHNEADAHTLRFVQQHLDLLAWPDVA